MAEVKPFAFVLMPFSDEFDDIYKLGIQAVAFDHNVVAERIDEQSFSEPILDRIYRQIDQADFIIADMTGKNANVFYEVGYAHAKGKPVVLLTQNVEDIPFDLKHHRHLVYNGSLVKLKELLNIEIRWQVSELAKNKIKTISTEFKTGFSILTDSDYRQKGSFDLEISFKNQSKRRSPEIEAMYLHSGAEWTVELDDTVCPSSETNKKPFALEHFIKPPLTRLSPSSWASIKVTCSKYFWRKWDGTKKLDSYNVKGSLLLLIVTSEGVIEEHYNLDITIDEIPF